MVDYCEIEDVKGVLLIDVAETKFDVQLAVCVTGGSSLVDGFLKAKGLVVPSVVPVLVKSATVFFAATFTLSVSPDINGVTDFGVNIIVTGSG